MSNMRSQFSDVAGTLDRNHRDLVNLLNQNHALKRELGDVEQNLRTSETGRAEGQEQRRTLSRRLARLKTELRQVDKRSRNLTGNLNTTRTRLIDAIAARSRLDTERRSLKNQVEGLDRRLARLTNNQKNLLNRVTATTARDLKRAERVIARVGLSVKKLLRRANSDAYGQGGPFIPADLGASRGFDDSVAIFDRHAGILHDVRGLLRRLPLATPLGKYRVSSRFGRRRDPINRKWARHDGVDLSGRLRSPVMATAPGKVVYAGWKGRYGRLVTIDHGLGIRTSYGHMRRIHVKRGQKVKFGQMIGQLGSSGRSTGAHLHYEIIVDGKPVNPVRFMKAGKDVFKG
jgi:murein DD-endopeptidase MepM/ murein hydrolase activator NlpD